MQKTLLLFFLLFSHNLFARSVPILSGPVVDEAHALTRSEFDFLGSELQRIYDSGRGPAQIQILIIKSLEQEPIEAFSIKVTDTWKLGRTKKDNGILILLALEDRGIRIEVGRALEGDVPDIATGRIIRDMTPYLREGAYADALALGIKKIEARLTGPASTEDDPLDIREMSRIFFVLVVILYVLINIFRGRGGPGGRGGGGGGRGWRRHGPYDPYQSPTTLGGPWIGGGSSGSGWGGGGGTFGGGGSSGKW